MDKNINIVKKVFSKSSFGKVVDIEFRELHLTQPNIPQVTIEEQINDFFNQYESLFYSIAQFGESKSHEFLIKKSSDYIQISPDSQNIQVLIDEINSLRQELLEANRTIELLSTK